jgi:hypothetical protein
MVEIRRTNSSPQLSTAIRTLLAGGFSLLRAERAPGYALIFTQRTDEFAATQAHCFVVAEDALGPSQIDAARIAANHHNSQLVVVGTAPTDPNALSWERFVNLFGGPVTAASVFDTSFVDSLLVLARNELPSGLEGRADDLFEGYVHSAFEFVFGGRVVRYGQNRRFEARPDGIIIPHWRFAALYDAKAYSDGYEVSADGIRQFCSYVEDFHSRYSAFVPHLTSFIVVSSTFPHDDSTLEGRSRDLYGKCHVPLCFLTAAHLAEVLALLIDQPRARLSIDWPRILADPILHPSRVREELSALGRDRLLP